jgi:hypothetical protein
LFKYYPFYVIYQLMQYNISDQFVNQNLSKRKKHRFFDLIDKPIKDGAYRKITTIFISTKIIFLSFLRISHINMVILQLNTLGTPLEYVGSYGENTLCLRKNTFDLAVFLGEYINVGLFREFPPEILKIILRC